MVPFDNALWVNLFKEDYVVKKDGISQISTKKRLRMVWWRGIFDWYIIIGLGVATFILGYIGFETYFVGLGLTPTVSDIIYLIAKLFTTGMPIDVGPFPITLDLARYLAAATTAYAVIRTILAAFREHFDLWALRFAKNHIIIVGLSEGGLNLVKNFRTGQFRVVVIDE